MKISVNMGDAPLKDVPGLAKKYENLGYDILVFHETKHDPFLAMALAAEHTQQIALRTAVAIAFPRSPMAMAYTTWDLQSLSGGRLELGLGSQVRGHIVRRFGVQWSPPAPRMREYVQALRAIWDCWQNGKPLRFQGNHYSFSLMTPFFNPGPIERYLIPIFISAVNPKMLKLAGEICNGVLLHPITTFKYVHQVVLPNLEDGAKRAGRSLKGFEIGASGLLVSGATKKEVAEGMEAARLRIAFYASTPRYYRMMSVHGWQDTAEKLHRMSLQGLWKEMAREITDEMVEEFAVVGTYDDLAEKLIARYKGYATCIDLSIPFKSNNAEKVAKGLIKKLKEA